MNRDELLEAIEYNTGEIAAGRLTQEHQDYLIAIGAMCFQEDQELEVDGKAGPNTRSALDKFINEAENPPDLPHGLPQGKGMFVRLLSHGGEPSAFIDHMKANGLTWVAIQRIWQYEDRVSKHYNTKVFEAYAKAIQEAGFKVFYWGYPVPGKEQEFVTILTDAVVKTGASGFIVDAEAPYIGKDGAGEFLMELCMTFAEDHEFLVGFTSYGGPWSFPEFPWGEFTVADFAINQAYDGNNKLDPKYPTRSMEAYYALGFKVIIPGFGAYKKSAEDLSTHLSYMPVPNGALIGWDWFNANNGDRWSAIKSYQIPS